MASKLNNSNLCKEIEKSLPSQEYALGKGLLQPFNNCNSGSRKIMHGTQTGQVMQLEKAEVPIIMSSYENRFAEKSSTFVRSGRKWEIIAKIPKYNMKYNIKSSNFTLVVLDPITNTLDIIDRVDYRYISESYGYSMDTNYLDSLQVGDTIPENTPIVKSNSFDYANNKCTGVNLRSIYMALAKTTEDPVILSQSAVEKMKAPLFDSLELQINDNDILLNLYGDHYEYKTFPDIGEFTKDGILCGIRREHKDNEAFYSQDIERLRQIFLTDDKRMRTGIVVDIDVYCNNLEKLESSMYNSQVYKYYQMKLEYCTAIVETIRPLKERGCKITYPAETRYYNSLWTIEGKQSIHDKVFSNIKLDIVTMNIIPLAIGDKITDRYGGKGVISDIWPDEMMPKIVKHYNGAVEWVSAEAIFNNSTIVNRENPGQSFETEITYIGERIVDQIASILYCGDASIHNINLESLDKCADLIMRFLNICNSDEAQEFYKMWSTLSPEDKRYYLDGMIQDENIFLCMPPMSSGMNLDKLDKLYKEFPEIDQTEFYVPQVCSTGEYRFIKANRKIIFGKKYINRLKQFAEEKFSAVSLAATNIKGENVKSNANKLHKAPHATTPVRFGDMEFLDMLHMNGEINIQILLLLCSAPKARRMFEKLLTGDPFTRDIRLPKDANSRQVEKVDVYLKTIGLALRFTKKKKRRPKGRINVASIVENRAKTKIVEEINPLIQNNLHELAEKRMNHKDRIKGKIRAAYLIDPESAQKLRGLPEDLQRDIFRQEELQKNMQEICDIIDRCHAEELLKILSGNCDKLIEDEAPKKKKVVLRHIVAKAIPGFDK